MIEQLCLDKIISWRGDEDDANKMDDILREVIVIDDDDDDEDQKQKSSAMLHNRSRRESSLEMIPADALQTQAIDYADVNQNDHEGRSFSHELDNEDTLPNPGRGPLYRQKQSRFDQNRLEQMAQHRSRRYEEALDRRRKYPEPIYIAGDNSISLSQDRAAGKASASSSQIRPLELYEMESRDRMVGALEHHDLQPMRAADNHILPRETRQAPSEQVRTREAAYVLFDGESPRKGFVLMQIRSPTPSNSSSRFRHGKRPSQLLPSTQ